MLGKQQLKDDFTVILTAILVIVAVGFMFTGVAEASNHKVEIDDNSVTQVPYGNEAIVNDTSISADTGFVIEDENGTVLSIDELLRESSGNVSADSADDVLTVLSESESLTVDTQVFQSLVTGDNLMDPRGQYTVRSETSATLNVESQDPSSATGDDHVYITEVSANVPYDIVVNRSGTTIGEEEDFNAGEGYTDYGLQLDAGETVSDGDSIEVTLINSETDNVLTDEQIDSSGVYNAGPDVTETASISTGSPVLSSTNTSANVNSYIYKMELVSQNGSVAGIPREYVFDTEKDSLSDFNDSRIINDALAVGSKSGVYFGQKLVLGFNKSDVDTNADYRLRRVDQDGDDSDYTETVDRSVEDNNITVNERMIEIDTGNLADETTALANYELREDGKGIFNFTVQRQAIGSSANDSFVNLETSDDTANINLTSNRIGFDVIITSDQLNETELTETLDETALNANNSEVEIEDEDNESVRITNVVNDNDLKTQIPLDFSGREANTYGFLIESADTGVTTNTSFEVDYGPSGQAEFDNRTYRENQGDSINMTITFEETDTATFRIKDEDYSPAGEDSLEFGIEETSGSDSVTITFDTYLADETNNSSIQPVSDDPSTQSILTIHGGEFTSTPSELPKIADRMSTGIYDLELEVNDRKVDQSVINLVERESESIDTWVLPSTEITGGPDIEDVEGDLGTPKDTIANGDWLVFEVQMSGIYNQRLINNNTKASALINYSGRDDLTGPADIGPDAQRAPEINMEVIGDRPAPNEDKPHLKIEKADSIKAQPDEDKFYLFFETNNTNNYEMFTDGFSVDETDDILTEYDVDINVTEDYKLVEDENNSADMNTTYEVVEREVETNMTEIITEESGLSSRFGIEAKNNSTVRGDTHIAPGSEVTLYVTSEEGADTIYQQRELTVEEQNNTSMGLLSTQFEFQDAEVGRNMTIEFSPMNEPEEAIIIEPDQPPVIESINSTTPVSSGEEVTFEVVLNQTNPDALSYDWDFGDDSGTSSAPQPTYVYEENGTYNVTLTVEDRDGETDSAEASVVVEQRPNSPPVIRDTIAPTRTLTAGEEAQFGVVATDDTSTDAIQYDWDFDDGNNATGVTTTHTFATQGTYNVTVTATDEDGATAVSDTIVQVEGSGETNGSSTEYDIRVNAQDESTSQFVPSATVAMLNSAGESVAQGTTNSSGAVELTVPNGSYDISVSTTGYEQGTLSSVPVEEAGLNVTVSLAPENSTTNQTDSSEEDPDQPGFTFLFGAVALAAAGGVVYRRRNGRGGVDKI